MAVRTPPTELRMVIEGEPSGASSGAWIDVHSPATGELVGRVPRGGEADVDRAVAAARAAFRDGLDARRVRAMEAARTLNFGHVQVNDLLMVTSECRTAGSSSPAPARTCPRTRSRSTRRSST